MYMFRDPAWKWLVSKLKLKNNQTIDQFNFYLGQKTCFKTESVGTIKGDRSTKAANLWHWPIVEFVRVLSVRGIYIFQNIYQQSGH